jgi:hypothetical protein
MKWFEEHLNWTAGIAGGFFTVLLVLIIFIIEQANSEVISLSMAFPNILIVGSWGFISGWILIKKNRSLAWIFFF